MAPQIVISCVRSYLVGSIPFSFIVAKKVAGVDLRFVGEGNVGARNVWHVVGRKYGVVAGVLDFLKGALAYGIGLALGLDLPWIWLCGVFVVMGHDFPVFLNGRGGKGAGSAWGFLLAMEPLIALCGVLAGIVYLLFRRFHLAMSIGMGSLPIFWKIVLNKSWIETAILVSFLLILGIKRVIDEPHMKRIRQESGW